MTSESPVIIREEYPVTPGQEALWILHQFFPDSGIYNAHLAWDIPPALDMNLFRRAMERVVARHPILRTIYCTLQNGSVVQQVLESWEPRIDCVELGEISEESLRQHIELELHWPFRPDVEPPVRWVVCKCSNRPDVLIFVQEHVSTDLWSFMVLINDLKIAYTALQIGDEPVFKPLEYTYFDHVKEQAELVASERGQQLAEFWRKQLEGMPRVLDLPADYPRPPMRTCSKRNWHFTIDEQLVNAFQQLASSVEKIPFIQFETLLHVLLHRYTGQIDIGIGVPTAGRDDRYRGVFGYFSNAIILRAQVDDKNTYLQQLQAQKGSVKSALAAQDYPFALLASEITDNRDPSRAALVQVCFVWESINRFENREDPIVFNLENGRQRWQLGALGEWNRHNLVQQLDDFDLTFKVYKNKETYEFSIEYNVELFKLTRIQRMARHFETLMRAVVSQPDCPLGQLNMLDEQEKHILLYDWNNTKSDFEDAKTLVSRFDKIVQQYPDRDAIRLNNTVLTYAQLDKLANQVAHVLSQRNLTDLRIVGVFMDRSPEWVACFLGILKAGAAYLPLDPGYPSERLQFIMEDARPTLVLTKADLQIKLPAVLDVNCVNWEDVTSESTNDRTSSSMIDTSQLAYVIYTSGSTGKPKGVMINHGNLIHLLHTQKTIFKLDEHNVILQFASMNFDASIFELTLALLSGATLQLAERQDLLGPHLLDFMHQRHVSWALLPPALLATLSVEPLPYLRHLVVGGDACSAELVEKWSKGSTFYNAYGPTECTVWATTTTLSGNDAPTIGRPLPNTQVYILNGDGSPQPIGVAGELCLAGCGISPGYLYRPELTAEKFVPNPFPAAPGVRIYKTGDLARYREDGQIEFLGRLDHQVKIRGFRIELGEIESQLRAHAAVHDALVMVREDESMGEVAEKLLTAYIVKKTSVSVDAQTFRHYLANKLPGYMIPAAFVMLDAFPLTPNDKIDRKQLPPPRTLDRTNQAGEIQLPRNEIERIIAEIWQSCLGINNISVKENFFDLGGHSLLLTAVYARLPAFLQAKISIVDLYKYPTIATLAHYLNSSIKEEDVFIQPDEHVERMRLRRRLMANISGVKIAIVGMAGRFPGAETVEQFWENICSKTESITFYTPEQLRQARISEATINAKNYVPAKGEIAGVADFDAGFFRFTPREAQITDPQQRLFLECAWQALEDAGCVPSRFTGRIGVYGGVGINQYLVNHLSAHPELLAAVGDYPLMLGNDKDFLCTRVAYKLNLDGPAMVVQTACSTSLVAVHTACQALLNEECDAALAGGVSLGRLTESGYFFHEGMIMSPDGHCRTFDADAAGTVQGQGCGVVLLKRLDDALRDNDHIYAVVAGSATNNDGSNKTGYTAPSIDGQSKAIRLAHASANIDPGRITYVEAHGTGTAVGDPIEIEALRHAFRSASGAGGEEASDIAHYNVWNKVCAIGSVKTNIGHLDAAAGIAGLIKTVKALEQQKLPPSLHFNTPNPKINFDQSPFYVNTELRDWETDGDKRYAGISSFGMGGTNAHLVLTQAPNETPPGHSRPWRLVTLSARSQTALDAMSQRFVEHLNQRPEQSFSNICYTLHVGRTLFPYRRHLVCRNREEAIAELMAANPQKVITSHYQERTRKIAFLFSGQGSQYIGMGKYLYQVELKFRKVIDECREKLSQKFIHVYEELSEADILGQTEKLNQTYITQPALFIFEYALAKLIISWGIKPDYMLGHSVGEYVAACLAGVFTLDEALELVSIRGQLMQQLEPGNMLSVDLSEQEALLLTNHDVSLAAINGERRCVLAGTGKAIQYLHEQLNKKGVENRILHTSHAFHSHMMEPMLERFEAYVKRRHPKPPTMPFISSLTGDWITTEEAVSPKYWADHLRHSVKFFPALNTLFGSRDPVNKDQSLIILEVGPGKVLTTLTQQHRQRLPQDCVLALTRHAYEEISDTQHLLKVLGRLWELGVEIDWDVFHSQGQRYRVPLPTYPFERNRYWVDAVTSSSSAVVFVEALQDSTEVPALPEEHSNGISPRNDVEAGILRHWVDCLGRSDFGVFDNFFDLGGDSLLAVNLVDRMNKEFQIALSAPVLILHPTIAELSDHIQANGRMFVSEQYRSNKIPIENSPLVLIQSGEAGIAPLFMVHPIGGEVFFYRDMARQLGTQQPFYAFQAPSLSGAEAPMCSVYALAERYVGELKKAGFKPPYFLGGSSFGGLVAYEMAQQLLQNGEEVRLLIMIDTPAPQQMPKNLTDSAAIMHYLLQDKLPLSLEKLRGLDTQAQIDYALSEAQQQGKGDVLPPHLGLPLFNTWIAHQQATFSYLPKPYPRNVAFFRHSESMPHFPPMPHLPWIDWVQGRLDIFQVPGNHITMNYPPHVKILAEYLKGVLQKG